MGLLKKPTKFRSRKDDDIKIVFNIPSTRLVGGKIRKKKEKPMPLRKKKIGLATLEGGGVGFIVGGTLGGLGGMVVGFPIGVIASNIYAKRKYKSRKK